MERRKRGTMSKQDLLRRSQVKKSPPHTESGNVIEVGIFFPSKVAFLSPPCGPNQQTFGTLLT